MAGRFHQPPGRHPRSSVLSPARALAIADPAADALEAADGKGITHRGITTANVKQTPEGRVNVLGVGLANATGAAGPAGAASSP